MGITAIVILALVAVIAVLWVIRYRLVQAGSSVARCAFRPATGGPWRTGLLRMGSHQVSCFVDGVAGPMSRFVWSRVEVIVTPTEEQASGRGVPKEAVVVRFTDGGTEADLALNRGDYLALRAWIESAPPGVNTDVA